MRLDVSTLGLLACLSGSAVAQGNAGPQTGSVPGTATVDTSSSTATSNAVIKVSATATPAIFQPSGRNGSIYYSWGPGFKNLTLRSVSLKTYGTDNIVGQGDIEFSSSPSTQTALEEDDRSLDRRRQLPPATLPITGNAVVFPIADSVSAFSNNLNEPLYLEFSWENSTSKGKSYSPLLAIADAKDYQVAADRLTAAGLGSNPANSESIESSADSSSSTTTASATAATAAPVSSAAKPGNNGLSTGAIIGIAIGCAVAGVLIIALLVWFLCFRRRRGGGSGKGTHARPHNAGYASDSGTRAMMADKEAAAVTERSPHSTFNAQDTQQDRASHDQYAPYSDAPGAGAGAAATAREGVAGVAVTTSDSQTNLAPGNGSGGQDGAARSPTPPITTRYAHLVEEGMTEAEIRRLEEEERHLDAAIEDAGRRDSGARAR
ncbi:hypothetical protein F5B20DRAFT_377838 [Whalleya microplaca]|nr:hypothetical protein F5B20DRAFT_377838 [Whalleya microplaca]